jgi:hypothetical protein
MDSDRGCLAPWTDANPLLIAGSFEWLHAACLAAGALGSWLWAMRV